MVGEPTLLSEENLPEPTTCKLYDGAFVPIPTLKLVVSTSSTALEAVFCTRNAVVELAWFLMITEPLLPPVPPVPTAPADKVMLPPLPFVPLALELTPPFPPCSVNDPPAPAVEVPDPAVALPPTPPCKLKPAPAPATYEVPDVLPPFPPVTVNTVLAAVPAVAEETGVSPVTYI